MKIRTVVLLFVIFCISFLACKKSDMDFRSNGIITGRGHGVCNCGGDWSITIDGTDYKFSSLPPGSNLNLDQENFPLDVELDWNTVEINCTAVCINNPIEISRIQKK